MFTKPSDIHKNVSEEGSMLSPLFLIFRLSKLNTANTKTCKDLKTEKIQFAHTFHESSRLGEL